MLLNMRQASRESLLIAEEALQLYLRTLSLLQRAIDHAREYWNQQNSHRTVSTRLNTCFNFLFTQS